MQAYTSSTNDHMFKSGQDSYGVCNPLPVPTTCPRLGFLWCLQPQAEQKFFQGSNWGMEKEGGRGGGGGGGGAKVMQGSFADLSTLAVGSECDAHEISINMYYIRVI